MNDKILCYTINIIYGSWSYSVIIINIRYSSRFNLIKISDETNTKYKVPIRINIILIITYKINYYKLLLYKL